MTTWDEPWKVILFQIFKIVMVVFLVLTMFSMGCYVDFREIQPLLRKPKGVLIGMLCQFVLMPLVSLGYAFACQLDMYQSIGLVFVATSPGGTTSNLFTYWVGGDVTLRLAKKLLAFTKISFSIKYEICLSNSCKTTSF